MIDEMSQPKGAPESSPAPTSEQSAPRAPRTVRKAQETQLLWPVGQAAGLPWHSQCLAFLKENLALDLCAGLDAALLELRQPNE